MEGRNYSQSNEVMPDASSYFWVTQRAFWTNDQLWRSFQMLFTELFSGTPPDFSNIQGISQFSQSPIQSKIKMSALNR